MGQVSKKSVRLGTVQETLLIPLYGRAVDQRRGRPGGALPLSTEAVLPFLSEDEVRRTLTMMAARIPGPLLTLDTAGLRLP
jgi:O-methyltransferase involved in polyketide biosynthesis